MTADGKVLDAWFPTPECSEERRSPRFRHLSYDEVTLKLGAPYAAFLGEDPVRAVRRIGIDVVIDLEAAPTDLYDLYLRLHLLSHRVIVPHQATLDGFLYLLDRHIAWTSLGPCPASDLENVRLRARAQGLPPVTVKGVFGVPPLLDYVSPAGVSIADANRILLGAHLAPGTVVTPEGFCGVNAGTLGPCFIEGRISAGVLVGAGSHVGGGASIMGSISGGNKRVITLGERCLLGANAGVGISLGDDCIVEAGCYITAGAKVTLEDGRVVRAEELSGHARLLFRRHSESGRLEALKDHNGWGGLNPLLHSL